MEFASNWGRLILSLLMLKKIKPTEHLIEKTKYQCYKASGFLQKDELAIKPLLNFNSDKRNLHHELPFSLSAY